MRPEEFRLLTGRAWTSPAALVSGASDCQALGDKAEEGLHLPPPCSVTMGTSLPV